MYPIATEKGINADGKMEYDVFGVRLKELFDIKSVLEIMKKESWLEKGTSMTLLRRILEENGRDDIFKALDGWQKDIDYGKWPNIDVRDLRNNLQFSSVRPIIYSYSNYYFSAPDIYEEILDVFKEYFGGVKNTPRRIQISPKLYTYLKVFHKIGFKMHRETEIKTIVCRKPRVSPDWYDGNISIARCNAMALMLLSGETTYFDGRDEKPIIVNGVVRTKLNWQDDDDGLKRVGGVVTCNNPIIDTSDRKLIYTYNKSPIHKKY